MNLRFYEESTPTGLIGVFEEIKFLLQQFDDEDACTAGMEFCIALDTMEDGTFVGDILPRILWQHLFHYTESLWARQVCNHSLYISRINASQQAGGLEVRALLVTNGIIPEQLRVQEAAHRHRRM